ncbi:hypothetical protein FFI97_003515 [Variovorax sp. KBS0712]|uniref:hypothetical protein n=1 Tax=Variovorax sp. KBS0712 TaxID=2578111 RepID=UPI00111A2714|nr:hypothetical protein [Variovorax sp. KBS0712]TSD59414.1 hypothetical protein FFI97_003515 [Variovorax sp. KBS0712]
MKLIHITTCAVAALLVAGCASRSHPSMSFGGSLVEHSLLRVEDHVSFALEDGPETRNFTVACNAPQAWLLYSDLRTGRSYPVTGRRYGVRKELDERQALALKAQPAVERACRATPPDWREVQRRADGTFTLIDIASVETSEGALLFWGAFDYPRMDFDLPYRAPFGQKRERFRLACPSQSYAQVSGFDIDERGRVTDGRVEGDRAKSYTVGGDTNADYKALFKAACSGASAGQALPAFTSRAKALPDPAGLTPPSPAVMKAVSQLGLPPAPKRLKRVVLEGTWTRDGKTTPTRNELQIAPDATASMFRTRTKTGTGPADGTRSQTASFLGLVDLSSFVNFLPGSDTISQAMTDLTLTGDWQRMAVGSELRYETKKLSLFSMIGGVTYDYTTVCKVVGVGAAAELHPALSGDARRLECRMQPDSLERTDTYVYLTDYGYALQLWEAAAKPPSEGIKKITAVEQ